MKIIVLGSGIIGVSTAWWLTESGHDVVVIDRATGPAQETSFANAGQISVCYSEPWANPQAPLKILRWLNQPDAPLLFKPKWDLNQWRWALSFLRECLPGRLAQNVKAMVRLAQYSRDTLAELRLSQDLKYDALERGIITFYRDQQDFESAQIAGDLMRDYGVERRVLTTEALIELEPTLAAHRSIIVGGEYTAEDESGDAHLFTVELAHRAAAVGAQFLFSTQATQISVQGGQVKGVETLGPDGSYSVHKADAVVVALGSFSAELVRPLGVPCLVYPTKGYSATFPIVDAQAIPTVSLTDSSHKIAFSRLGNRLRMAGTAEMSGYSRGLSPLRCKVLSDVALELFGDALDQNAVQYWSGLRPSTPSNVPLIGRTRIQNLYLNTGHGTLGWTMGIGSGRALADLINGRRPEPEFPFLGV